MLNTIDKPILRIPEKPTPVFNDRPRKMLDTMRPRMCKITSKITAVNRTRWEWVNRCSKVQPVGSVAYLLAETHFLSSYYHFDSISLVKQALDNFFVSLGRGDNTREPNSNRPSSFRRWYKYTKKDLRKQYTHHVWWNANDCIRTIKYVFT